MQVNDITLSPNTCIRLKLRALYHRLTRAPRSGEEERWQEKLTELDPELHLRWNHIHKHWSIYYDHHGLLTVVRTFKPGESFYKTLKNLRHNATLNARRLRQMKAEHDDQILQDENKVINECAEEFAVELHHATRRRVINDGVKDNQY
jgi:hypothetical protein